MSFQGMNLWFLVIINKAQRHKTTKGNKIKTPHRLVVSWMKQEIKTIDHQPLIINFGTILWSSLNIKKKKMQTKEWNQRWRLMKKKEKSLLVKLREVPVVETRCCYQSLVSSCLGISFSHSRTCPTPPRSINRWTETQGRYEL